MLFDPRPALLGHRGLGRGVVDGHEENTLGSFLAAAELGLRWLEIDVRRTADDVLVVTHEPASDGVFYDTLPGAEAAARGTLLLADLLEALPPHVGVDLDLKTVMSDAARRRDATTAALLAGVAAREARRRPVVVTSFDPSALAILRELAPGLALGLLTWVEFPAEHAVAAVAHLDVQLLAVHVWSVLPNRFAPPDQLPPLGRIVEAVHAAGRELLAWCPEPELVPPLVEAGTDALCVNDVPTVLAAGLVHPAPSLPVPPSLPVRGS